MTPDQLYASRETLGRLWNKGRPLHASELGRALRLGGRDPGASVRDYERGKTTISGKRWFASYTYKGGTPGYYPTGTYVDFTDDTCTTFSAANHLFVE